MLKSETVNVVFDGVPGMSASLTLKDLDTLLSKLAPLVGTTAVMTLPLWANSS